MYIYIYIYISTNNDTSFSVDMPDQILAAQQKHKTTPHVFTKLDDNIEHIGITINKLIGCRTYAYHKVEHMYEVIHRYNKFEHMYIIKSDVQVLGGHAGPGPRRPARERRDPVDRRRRVAFSPCVYVYIYIYRERERTIIYSTL